MFVASAVGLVALFQIDVQYASKLRGCSIDAPATSVVELFLEILYVPVLHISWYYGVTCCAFIFEVPTIERFVKTDTVDSNTHIFSCCCTC